MKQDVVFKSSTEVEYHVLCEPLWLRSLLIEFDFKLLVIEFDFKLKNPIHIHCDNQSTIYIAQNPMFHNITKYIKIDYHLFRYIKKVICIVYSAQKNWLII